MQAKRKGEQQKRRSLAKMPMTTSATMPNSSEEARATGRTTAATSDRMTLRSASSPSNTNMAAAVASLKATTTTTSSTTTTEESKVPSPCQQPQAVVRPASFAHFPPVIASTTCSLVVPPRATASSAAADAAAASSKTAATAKTTTPSNNNSSNNNNINREPKLHFISSDRAVKSLFALPYTVGQDRAVHVAVHNLDGTLLLLEDDDDDDDGGDFKNKDEEGHDNDLNAQDPSQTQTHSSPRHRRLLLQEQKQKVDASILWRNESKVDEHEHDKSIQRAQDQMMQALVALSSSTNSHPQSEDLTTVIQKFFGQQAVTATADATSSSVLSSNHHHHEHDHHHHHAAIGHVHEPQQQQLSWMTATSTPEPPRQYLSWTFQDMNLWVGSNAIIVRSPPQPTTSTPASSSSLPCPSAVHARTTTPAAASNLTAAQPKTTTTTTTTTSSSSSSSLALTIRIENAEQLRTVWQHHDRLLKSGVFVPDHRLEQQQQQHKALLAEQTLQTEPRKLTYADVVARQQQQQPKQDSVSMRSKEGNPSSYLPGDHECENDDSRHPWDEDDDKRIYLQTCIVPSPRGSASLLSVGGVLSAAAGSSGGGVIRVEQDRSAGSLLFSSTSHGDSNGSSVTCPSIVSTVLDTYLDNIMANVPQLALCLREKGFIQSVKLLETNEVPITLMQSTATFDTSKPWEYIRPLPSAESVFSPHIMEMNAATLLRFLQTHCNKDNATYLLRREAGGANIQLYDISAISAQGKRKWIWWLAMMSYRFANRLRHLSSASSPLPGSDQPRWDPSNSTSCSKQHQLHDKDGLNVNTSSLRRHFRSRQRSLLHNTLDLLETLSDMNGHIHESLVAAVRESLADTFLGDNVPPLACGEDIENEDQHHQQQHRDKDNCKLQHHPATMQSDKSTSAPQRTGSPTTSLDPHPAPATSVSSQQPYMGVSVDSLTKAQDLLVDGIRALRPSLDRIVAVNQAASHSKAMNRNKKRAMKNEASTSKDPSASLQQGLAEGLSAMIGEVRVVSVDTDDSDSEWEGYRHGAFDDRYYLQIEPLVTQLVGLHHKLINVLLRLAEIHLKNYYSSSAMRALRTGARRMSDTLYFVQLVARTTESLRTEAWIQRLQLQLIWLWEHCGHFARSYAADPLWRERGHASGDDVVSVLQDVEAAFLENPQLIVGRGSALPSLNRFLKPQDRLRDKSHGSINLHSVSGIVDVFAAAADRHGSSTSSSTTTKATSSSSNHLPSPPNPTHIDGCHQARALLEEQHLLRRDQRKVLVAACIAYSRAIASFTDLLMNKQNDDSTTMKITNNNNRSSNDEKQQILLELLHQRLGDACNETGKVLMNELRRLLGTGSDCQGHSLTLTTADPLLSSAQFWFLEGVHAFEACHDLRNLALLRCNLCQCWKLRANAMFDTQQMETKNTTHDSPTHADECIQEAARQLQAAHEAIGVRDVDPVTWDMVSNELAATFLVLGVRRRQSLIGSGSMPVLLRLSPGKERSIVEPMERALDIYQQCGNPYQTAATHYQLALLYSKIWTCQRDETKTKEKLSAAFHHFYASHAYFSSAVRGNEVTLCLLCLDFSGLYVTVSGTECINKALSRCLDTIMAFSPAAVESAIQLSTTKRLEWFQKMDTLASSVEERVFKLIRNLIKLHEEQQQEENEDDEGGSSWLSMYKDLYRAGLAAKMFAAPTGAASSMTGDEFTDPIIIVHLQSVYRILDAIQQKMIFYDASRRSHPEIRK